MEDFQLIGEIGNLLQGVGMWAIFAWLYVREKEAHAETRKDYREDLREIAGMRQNLRNTQVAVKNWQSPDVQVVTE